MTCPFCDQPLEENTATCPHCGGAVQGEQPVPQSQPIIPQPTPAEKPENILNGIIGAIGGALLGCVIMVLLYLVNAPIAGLSGFVAGILALKGYEILGGKLTKRGILTGTVSLIPVPFLAYFLSLSLFVWGDGLPFGKALVFVLRNMWNGPILLSVVKNLLILYLFTALGAFSAISSAVKKTRSL